VTPARVSAIGACLVFAAGCGFVKVRVGDPPPASAPAHASTQTPAPREAPLSVATPIDTPEPRETPAPPHEDYDERRLRLQCEATFDERRLAAAKRGAQREEAARARRARDEEQKKLAEYQKAHCRLTTEDVIDREPCDDGSNVVKMCNFVVDQLHWAICPASAPREIRGKHSVITIVGDAPAGARVARLTIDSTPPMDLECRRYDSERGRGE
jgi:hypothetical protein